MQLAVNSLKTLTTYADGVRLSDARGIEGVMMVFGFGWNAPCCSFVAGADAHADRLGQRALKGK